VLLGLLLTSSVALILTTALLLGLGHRVHRSSRAAGAVLGLVVVVGAGEVAARVWLLPTTYVVVGEILLAVLTVVVVIVRPVWNPIGQVFYGAFLASAVSYLAFAVSSTLAPGLSPVARLASLLVLVLELAALLLSGSFAFESCDSVCRTRPSRPDPAFDPAYQPMVSLHLATYNEPPDMLIETIRSLEAIDYPNFEIVIVDNNTKDPDVWRPVEDYCKDRPRVTFVHVDPWPGFKSGALNLALARHTDPKAEIIGIVDADYFVDPSWLRAVVGHFVDPNVAFLQTPQDYREFEHDGYLQACYDAYRYFFVTTMPSRHQRNSIIFAGTMGLLRRSVIDEVGGWDEWCITEDAELSLRMLKAGHEGIFIPTSYGHGIMPLTFSSLKSQRFRWCFGGMQILRSHWRDLVPWSRAAGNHLSVAQRVDYLFGSVQWLNDLVYFTFTVVLLASGFVLAWEGPFGLRPLHGAAVLLPAALVLTGVIRALWALRVQAKIPLKRSVLAFLNWLSLSWIVALACVQGLVRKEGVFLRTPKESERNRLLAALWSARAETGWALLLWAVAALVFVQGRATGFVLALFVWQGLIYASAPFMSWLNQHTELSAQLERRRRTERLRERAASLKPLYQGSLVGATAAVAVAVVIGFGGSNPGQPADPFAVPPRSSEDRGPLANLVRTAAPSRSTTPGSLPARPDESDTPTEPTDATTSVPADEEPSTSSTFTSPTSTSFTTTSTAVATSTTDVVSDTTATSTPTETVAAP